MLCVQKPKDKNVRYTRARITGSYKLPQMDDRNCILSSLKEKKALKHLSSPNTSSFMVFEDVDQFSSKKEKKLSFSKFDLVYPTIGG